MKNPMVIRQACPVPSTDDAPSRGLSNLTGTFSGRAATARLTALVSTASSAIARQSTDSRRPCEFRRAAGLALEEAQDLVASAPRLRDRKAWKALVEQRWTEIASETAAA